MIKKFLSIYIFLYNFNYLVTKVNYKNTIIKDKVIMGCALTVGLGGVGYGLKKLSEEYEKNQANKKSQQQFIEQLPEVTTDKHVINNNKLKNSSQISTNVFNNDKIDADKIDADKIDAKFFLETVTKNNNLWTFLKTILTDLEEQLLIKIGTTKNFKGKPFSIDNHKELFFLIHQEDKRLAVLESYGLIDLVLNNGITNTIKDFITKINTKDYDDYFNKNGDPMSKFLKEQLETSLTKYQDTPLKLLVELLKKKMEEEDSVNYNKKKEHLFNLVKIIEQHKLSTKKLIDKDMKDETTAIIDNIVIDYDEFSKKSTPTLPKIVVVRDQGLPSKSSNKLDANEIKTIKEEYTRKIYPLDSCLLQNICFLRRMTHIRPIGKQFNEALFEEYNKFINDYCQETISFMDLNLDPYQ
jgi:hypothetical protein